MDYGDYNNDVLLILDTIPGRQCMSSCFFLLKQFDDVLIYLNSIKVCVFPAQTELNWTIEK